MSTDDYNAGDYVDGDVDEGNYGWDAESYPKLKPLYENCTMIGNGDNLEGIYAYSPPHSLDENLFRSLVSNHRLQRSYVSICDMGTPFPFLETFKVEDIYLMSATKSHPMCSSCGLALPIDLTYYVCGNQNACHLCYVKNINEWKRASVKKAIIDSGLDNVNDWVRLFDYSYPTDEAYLEMEKDGWALNECELYCNLYPNSVYYGRFAFSYYVSGLGECIDLAPDTSLDSILDQGRITI